MGLIAKMDWFDDLMRKLSHRCEPVCLLGALGERQK